MNIKHEAYIIGLLYLVVLISAIYVSEPDIDIPYWKALAFFCGVYLIGGAAAKKFVEYEDS